jgi:hypothetical protein
MPRIGHLNKAYDGLSRAEGRSGGPVVTCRATQCVGLSDLMDGAAAAGPW